MANLVITNYLDFWFYRDAELVSTISVGLIQDSTIVTIEESFDDFKRLFANFAAYRGRTITSSLTLAKMMAGKSRLMANVFGNALETDLAEGRATELTQQFDAFKSILMNEIEPREFADIFAQTIAYGMFAARLHDKTLEDFTRQEAAGLIPKTNPFLRKLFYSIAGPDLDERIDWLVDELADIFRATDIAHLLKDFGSSTGKVDPFINFYENFLGAYDPAQRKKRGVWYTPEPVVSFIVDSVNCILQDTFSLKSGLADSSKMTIKFQTDKKDRRTRSGYVELEKEIHRLQILDPATGTGTFLAEVVRQIYPKFKSQQGIWSDYVEKDLIPRLHGFEILMAPYAVAHLKLEMLLTETGFDFSNTERLRIFLTNTLEEYHPDTGTLFATWLSNEANEANHVKRDTPVMLVLGNPPYAVSSSNMGDWIRELVGSYKEGLDERKINLDDDYIKFIRYGEECIRRNGDGILAFITNNSYLEGITHRQMRKHLLETFDTIFIIDLHGDSNKGEVCPDGSADKNVFDIQQGVAISIFVKHGRKGLADVFRADIYGSRADKYEILQSRNIKEIEFQQVDYQSPSYYFAHRDHALHKEYESGFAVNDLFINYNTGIQSKRDALCMQIEKSSLEAIKEDFTSEKPETIRSKYGLVKDNRDWKVFLAQKDLRENGPKVIPVCFRPFDRRWTFYTGKSRGFLGYPRHTTMKHMLAGDNIALLTGRQNKSPTIDSFFVTSNVSEMKCAERTIQSYHMPLYTYEEDRPNKDLLSEDSGRESNLNPEIVQKIASILGLEFSEDADDRTAISSIDIFDYVYAMLHSNLYRDTYKDSLKGDFPRVPYPEDREVFWSLVDLGREIRSIHLLNHEALDNLITSYPVAGDNRVTRSIVKADFELQDCKGDVGRVWINDNQFVDGIPVRAWQLYIGGYLPAQKWLKMRKARVLDSHDLIHYQRIIVALVESDRVMKEIDEVFGNSGT